jgi:polysaccharide biosynthesis protein PslA
MYLEQNRESDRPAPANDVTSPFLLAKLPSDPVELFDNALGSRYWEGPFHTSPRLVSASVLDQRHKKYRRVLVGAAAVTADGIAVALSWVAVTAAFPIVSDTHLPGVAWLLISPLFVMAALILGSFRVASLYDLRTSLSIASKAWIYVLLAMPALILFTRQTGLDASFHLGLVLVAMLPSLLVSRIVSHRFAKAVLGEQPYVEVFIEDGLRIDLSTSALAFNARRNGLAPDPTDAATVSRLAELLRNVDLVTVYAPPSRRAAWVRTLRAFDVRVDVRAPELQDIAPLALEYRGNGWQMVAARHPMGIGQAAIKRLFDIVAVLTAIPLLAIIMTAVAVMIKLDSPGPVLFRQKRVGRGNRIFHIYKFRSMRTDRQDFSGTVSAARNDDRITAVGRWIRRTSIDELPQLLNVLRGEMSLVGPRPHAVGSRAQGQLFWEIDDQYWMRHAIKPGLTGLAQVNGYRGATDHRDDLVQRVRSDLEYAAKWSLRQDICIILRTFGVLKHNKAY